MLSHLVSLVLICYSHTWNEELQRSPLSIVTALVDKIGIASHLFMQKQIQYTASYCVATQVDLMLNLMHVFIL